MRSAAPMPTALAFALLLAPALHAAPAPTQAPPAHVRAEETRLEEVQDRRPVTGNVRAAQRALVAAEEPGLVLELLAREGELVEKGQPLARLDARRLELELARARAEERLAAATLAEREIALERAERDLEILEELSRRDAGNPRELADAASDVRGAQARREQAREERAIAEERRKLLEKRVLDMQPRAPFSGVVVARRTEAGQWIGAGGPLVELLSVGRGEVWLDVPQRFLMALREAGSAVLVTDDATGEQVEIAGWRLVPDVDPRARTFRMIGELPEGAPLVPGMSVTAEVPTGALREHLLVSTDAILRSETGPFVYVAAPAPQGEGHVALMIPVDLLFHAGKRVAVRAARLEPGSLVVVEGNERLWPMAPIAVTEVAPR